AMPGWIYHDDNSVVTPFSLAPEPMSVALSFAYSPSYTADHKLIVGGTGAPIGSPSLVSRCTGATCTLATPLAVPVGTLALLVRPGQGRHRGDAPSRRSAPGRSIHRVRWWSAVLA